MRQTRFTALAITTSLTALIHASAIAPAAYAQNYPYDFCQGENETPDQELVNSIAFMVAYNYGEVKSVSAVCYGTHPRGNVRAFVYRAQLSNGAVDVAINNDQTLISFQDPSKQSADANGWTAWMELKSPN